MTAAIARHATLIEHLWPRRAQGRALRLAVLIGFGFCLLTLSAKVQVPFWPVPMTMQTFAVLVIAMAYGGRLGAATVAAYLLAGAAGMPVLAGTPERGIGLAYMMGPTGGFLAGFFLAACVVGWLGDRGFDRSVWLTAAAMILGHAIISLSGVVWLATAIGLDPWRAIEVGVIPFMAGSAFKTALGIAFMPLLWQLVYRRDPAARREG